MLKLYKLFVFQSLKELLFMLLMGLCALFLLSRLELALMSAMLLPYCWLFAVVRLSTQHMSRNLSWLLGVPLRKRELALLNLFINLSLFALTGIATAMLALALILFNQESRSTLQALEALERVLKLPLEPTLGAWVTILGFATAILTFSFGLVRRDGVQMTGAKAGRGHGRTFLTAAMAGILALFVYFFRELLDNRYALFTLLTALALRGAIFMAARSVGLSRSERRKWVAAASAIAVIQSTGVFALASHGLRAHDPNRVAASLLFLGRYAGEVSPAEFARVLALPLKGSQFGELGQKYLELFNEGRRLSVSQASPLSFRKLLRSKTQAEDIQAAMALFDPKSLRLAEVRVALKSLSKTVQGKSRNQVLHWFLPAKLSTEDTIELLSSENELESSYALLRARYFRDARFLPVIQKELKSYSEEQKWEARNTLGVLIGRQLSLSEFADLLREKRLALKFYEAHCDRVNLDELTEKSKEGTALLNICLRENGRELAGLPQRVEDNGWLEPPLKNSTRIWLKNAIRSRDAF